MELGRTGEKGKEKYRSEKKGGGRRGRGDGEGKKGERKRVRRKGEEVGGEGEKGKNVMTRQKARSFLMFPLRSYHTMLQQESLSHFCSTIL